CARRDRAHPGRRAAGPARQGRHRLRHRDAAARRGGAARARRGAVAGRRLRQLPVDPQRDPDRPHPRPARRPRALRRQRGVARGPTLPAVRGRARARRHHRLAHRARLAGRPSRLRAALRRRHELPARLMATPMLETARLAGQKVGPTAVTVDARWLMAYAAALGETDPRYYDTTTPGGPIAHPLFPVCYEWSVALTLRSKTIKPELLPLGVHSTHHLVIHRRPRSEEHTSELQ